MKTARRMEISRDRLGKWERGLHAPALEDAAKLSVVLEVSLDELVLGASAPALGIPPAEREEAAARLSDFLRVIGPWLKPQGVKGKEKE